MTSCYSDSRLETAKSMKPSKPIPILTYHQIENAPPRGTPMRSLYVSPRAFQIQMWILKVLGYRGLSMTELSPYLSGERSGKVVGITFDDGYLNNLIHAAPILKKFEFTSTCYVVTDLMGTTNSWDAGIGVPSASLMNLEELMQWKRLGQEIGSHTLTHRNLMQMNQASAEDEIVRSKGDLERKLGESIHQFCYPYGDYDSSHAALVQQAGYLGATTTKRGRVNSGLGLGGRVPLNFFELPRIPIVRSTSWLQFLLKVVTPYEDHHA